MRGVSERDEGAKGPCYEDEGPDVPELGAEEDFDLRGGGLGKVGGEGTVEVGPSVVVRVCVYVELVVAAGAVGVGGAAGDGVLLGLGLCGAGGEVKKMEGTAEVCEELQAVLGPGPAGRGGGGGGGRAGVGVGDNVRAFFLAGA